ncbi:uncharacterized protein MYCFIDRAFT_174330 [Pseudocercospora fijiensis CIRAD86]|uniref:Uncharacterized protein n=1 Tax=Pseudocercospora fijiensis (strain CIRAD86) TaxID=383855 RepID=M2ZUX0_PSEFD|nr:uncharacterized protein MYCFIDRAFT_174330 [Pseudocercospora fijiensis CIRAD86]EME82789.1 hypothetical protein MYCFIDRAFT_174330 [Pseudocercospora fijiensis CIRAD86]
MQILHHRAANPLNRTCDSRYQHLYPRQHQHPLDLASELEKVALCDIVSNLVAQEVAITSARNFWDAASTAASTRGYERSGPEIRYILNKCHQEGRAVANATRYIQDKMRVGGGKCPGKISDYNAPGFVSEDQKKRLEETAKAVALMDENGEGKGYEMSFHTGEEDELSISPSQDPSNEDDDDLAIRVATMQWNFFALIYPKILLLGNGDAYEKLGVPRLQSLPPASWKPHILVCLCPIISILVDEDYVLRARRRSAQMIFQRTMPRKAVLEPNRWASKTAVPVEPIKLPVASTNDVGLGGETAADSEIAGSKHSCHTRNRVEMPSQGEWQGGRKQARMCTSLLHGPEPGLPRVHLHVVPLPLALKAEEQPLPGDVVGYKCSSLLTMVFVLAPHTSPRQNRFKILLRSRQLLQMNAQVVVVCVIVGAGAAVLIGYATTRYFFGNTSNNDGPTDEFNQAAYMREVRLRNVEQIGAINGYGHRHMARLTLLSRHGLGRTLTLITPQWLKKPQGKQIHSISHSPRLTALQGYQSFHKQASQRIIRDGLDPTSIRAIQISSDPNFEAYSRPIRQQLKIQSYGEKLESRPER